MNKNSRFSNYDGFPLCRFGPGGDFVTNWPAGKSKVSKASRRPIGTALNAIAKMLDTVIAEELLHNSTIEKINSAIHNAELNISMEDKSENDKSNGFNASSVSGLEAGGQLQTQPMLFDNSSGTGANIRNKQNFRIRAGRKSKRKSAAFSRSWQGSLFESHDQSAKVA